jgi:hypothetical protein
MEGFPGADEGSREGWVRVPNVDSDSKVGLQVFLLL